MLSDRFAGEESLWGKFSWTKCMRTRSGPDPNAGAREAGKGQAECSPHHTSRHLAEIARKAIPGPRGTPEWKRSAEGTMLKLASGEGRETGRAKRDGGPSEGEEHMLRTHRRSHSQIRG